MALPSFTATFNPSPDPPASNQFFLTDANGSTNNLVLIDDDTNTIEITLAGATFPTEGVNFPPIAWSLLPDSILSGPTVSDDGSTLTFTVPAPTHVLFPWAFRFIADVPGVPGVRSQNIYLSKTASGNSFILKYASDNGNVSIVDSLDSSQEGAILGAELIMVNTQFGIVSVTLESDPPVPVRFADPAIYWGSGGASDISPDWISVVPGEMALSLDISRLPSAMGKSTGLQFAIFVDNGTPEGLTILSPDPIIINSTIGDG